MATRRQLVLLLAGIFASMGASYRTTNFMVEAATPQIAEQVGKWAEYYRKEKAILWIGREMPPWSEPCPLRVTVAANGAGGATSFSFTGGQVWQTMHIEGPLDRLLASVLPHEVTHTVFAHYFRQPVPRWADEGGAVLSEDDLERSRHDQMVRQMISAQRAFPLVRLFNMREYPRDMRDVSVLYAEGYSVADFLVATGGRKAFLDFVAHGMQYGWDGAAQTYYRYQNVNQLQQGWLDYLVKSRQQPRATLARNTSPAQATTASRVVVRLTAPIVDPLLEAPAPLVRAQAPDAEVTRGWNEIPRSRDVDRQDYVPDYPAPRERTERGQPAARLGAPQFDPAPEARARRTQGTTSPAGFPE